MSKILSSIPVVTDERLLTGFERGEDAGVYKLSDTLAIIQTLDFFTPIVDDPFSFGEIAVANALSDVYAMGGEPITAMNIVCFPISKMDGEILKEILHGGYSKLKEAGVLLVGGHSVEDDEIKYGLSVTGIVAPDKVFFNCGAKAGDKLVLTKPLGTGVISTAIKADSVSKAVAQEAVKQMSALNMMASKIAQAVGSIHACTDVTGFGFLGHMLEMLFSADVGFIVDSKSVPIFDGVGALLEEGFVPGGLYRNKTYQMPFIDVAKSCSPLVLDVMFDPQTSGGLLLALPDGDAQELVRRLIAGGINSATIVGEVVTKNAGRIMIV